MLVTAFDGTSLNIQKVALRMAAERTYLFKFEDPDYGVLSAVVSIICLENPDRLQDAEGYIAQYVKGMDGVTVFPYNSYPRMDALYEIVRKIEKDSAEQDAERIPDYDK